MQVTNAPNRYNHRSISKEPQFGGFLVSTQHTINGETFPVVVRYLRDEGGRFCDRVNFPINREGINHQLQQRFGEIYAQSYIKAKLDGVCQALDDFYGSMFNLFVIEDRGKIRIINGLCNDSSGELTKIDTTEVPGTDTKIKSAIVFPNLNQRIDNEIVKVDDCEMNLLEREHYPEVFDRLSKENKELVVLDDIECNFEFNPSIDIKM